MSLLKRKEPPPRLESPAQRERKAELVEGVRHSRQRVNLDALTLDEAAELRELHRKALAPTEDGLVRSDLEALTEKERRRFLQLLDQCLPENEREKRRHIRAEREERALQALADELANEGMPPAKRLCLRSGEVVLPPDVVELDALRVSDIGLLVVVVHAWSSGRVPFRGATWSDDGTALYVPKRLQLVSEEANRTYTHEARPTTLVDVARTLEHLARNDFLEVERDAAGWTVRLGPRLTAWSDGRSS